MKKLETGDIKEHKSNSYCLFEGAVQSMKDFDVRGKVFEGFTAHDPLRIMVMIR